MAGAFPLDSCEKPMQLNIASRQKVLLAILMGLALFGVLIFYLITETSLLRSSALPTQTALSSSQERPRAPLPVRLTIPKIAVDSAVEYVGMTPEGEMDVPKNQDDVAWFELGPRPGENGSAIIAGHYGRRGGEVSAFDNLYTLRKGDKVYVENEKGETISFVVRGTRRYDPTADASDVFISGDGEAHLNLITCEGVWDEDSQTYPLRLVVFTDKE